MKALALTIGAASVCAVLGVAHEAEPRSPGSLADAPLQAQAALNPYRGDPDAVRAGRKLYARHCASCHGGDARGTRTAPGLDTSTVRHATHGGLFWFLTNGNRGAGMPSWSRLPDARRWQLVAFLKAADTATAPAQP